jgi:tRNA A37 threonylcarbamoyladenosine synthetase subunit TsaC/SUA5/YrdC
LWDKVPLILDGGPCEVGIESTVISLVGKLSSCGLVF